MLFPQKFPLLILFLSLGEEQKQRMAWDAAEIVWTLASLNVFLEIFPDISERHLSMDKYVLELVIIAVVTRGAKMCVEPRQRVLLK